jgi:Protein of unknown function (DUF1566)
MIVLLRTGEEDFRHLRSSASETLNLQAVRRPLNQPVAQSSDSRCCVSCKSVTIVHIANQANAKIYKMEVTKRKAISRTVLVLLAAVVPLTVAQSSTQGQDSPQQTQVRGYWTDPTTGLMWAAKDNGKDLSWHNAIKYCRNLHLAGYSDWRLANMFELQPLYDKTANAPGRAGDTKGGSPRDFTWHVKGNLFLSGDEWSSRVDGKEKSGGYEYYFDFNEGKSNDNPVGWPYPFNGMRALCVRGSGDPLGRQRQP